MKGGKVEQRQTNLDLLRGLAALAVAAGHIQSYFHVDYSKIIKPNAFDAFFYFVCSQQGLAVMCFFVLSGFFVGGSVLDSFSQNRWSWTRYGIQRLTRLWTVLIPALFFTLALDMVGKRIGDHVYYAGARDSFNCFCGNLFFLQTVTCADYGSNGALWSLANEFWYYLLFPLVYFSLFTRGKATGKVFCAAAAALALVLLPRRLTALGLIWLMGVAASRCVSKPSLFRVAGSLPFFIGSVLLFSLTLAFTSREPQTLNEGLVGLSAACLLPFLASREVPFQWYQKISKILSEMSYSLYAFHLPIVFFFFFGLRIARPRQPSVESYLLFGLLLSVVFVCAYALWFLFERRTGEVRRFVSAVLLPGPKG
jgi:peptidoglycan/LPS O-acetylase OafA/YrhL